MIWKILNDDTKDNKNESGLHCKGNGQSGAATQLCDLLGKLRNKSNEEKGKLKAEEADINKYIKNVTEYKCDCTFADWDGPFGECAGPNVNKVNIYKTCENAEKIKEAEGEAKCPPTKSSCGVGKHSKTRTRRWDAKDGGDGETGQKCIVGVKADGEYSAVDENNKQKFTAICLAGEFNGKCREYFANTVQTKFKIEAN